MEVSDNVICIDDRSSDESASIAKNLGAEVFSSEEVVDYGWPELTIRRNLLEIGRQYGGTHFICLDADEIISTNFIKQLSKVESLKKGQKIEMQWLALWKSFKRYKNDSSIWSNNFKDFIFRDDGKADFLEINMHTPRTPTAGWDSVKLDKDEGNILHLQFCNWDAFQIKQCWYRCSELIESKGSNVEIINKKYSITLDKNKFKNSKLRDLYEFSTTAKVKDDWVRGVEFLDQDQFYIQSYWRLDQIKDWFQKYSPNYFEKLDIWHIQEIKNLLDE